MSKPCPCEVYEVLRELVETREKLLHNISNTVLDSMPALWKRAKQALAKAEAPSNITGCNVPECWHYITLFNGKCQCSSIAENRTGQPGCPGFKERKDG